MVRGAGINIGYPLHPPFSAPESEVWALKVSNLSLNSRGRPLQFFPAQVPDRHGY